MWLSSHMDKDCQRYEGLFAARTDEQLEQLMRETDAPLEWIRSQNGNVTTAQIWAPEIKARGLYSITPILEFLRAFAGVTEPGLSHAELQKAEDKLGPLPLPIREYYALFPKAYYKTHNTLRPLSSIRKTKNGILYFLEENQNSCHWGFSLDTPFLYCQEESKWEVSDYLDTFLAQEFAFELMSREELGLEFDEVDDIKPEVMAPGRGAGQSAQGDRWAVPQAGLGLWCGAVPECGRQGGVSLSPRQQQRFLHVKGFSNIATVDESFINPFCKKWALLYISLTSARGGVLCFHAMWRKSNKRLKGPSTETISNPLGICSTNIGVICRLAL